jgi:PKD repeat protein
MGIGPLRSRALRGLLLISAVAFFGCGDGTPPEIQITSPAPGAVVKSGEPAAISFEVHDEGSSYLVFSKRSGLAHATVVAETEAGEVEFSAEVTSEGTHTLSWTPGGSEKYWIRVSAVDKSDNHAQESAAVVNHVEVVANFVVTPASGIPPLVVTVQDESANATSWEWDFGDGSDIVEQQSPPQHTYEEAGRYTIKLVVKGVGERSDELTQIVDVSYPTGASEYAQYATVPVTSPAPQGPVPPRYDLSKYLPPVRSQGQQGSCTAWAVGYYLKGFQEAHERGWDASSEDHQFSPAFVYNQITLGSCTGTSVPANMTILSDMGVCAWRTMPYTDQECSRQPSAGAKSEAADYRIRDFTRINFHDPTNVKGYVAGEERPVVLVIKIDSAFDRLRGDDVFHEFIGGREGLHAVLLVGYDDGKQAYKIVNSWGTTGGTTALGGSTIRSSPLHALRRTSPRTA